MLTEEKEKKIPLIGKKKKGHLEKKKLDFRFLCGPR